MIFTTKLILAFTYFLILNFTAFAYCVFTYRAFAHGLRTRTHHPESPSISRSAIYVLACLGGAIGIMLGMLIFHRKLRTRTFHISMPLILIGHLALFFFIYTGIYNRADETAMATPIDRSGKLADFFDGPGQDDLIIFYPGAKVEPQAYAPLMRKIADGGVDCYLLHAPFRMAMLDIEEAGKIDTAGYKNIYVAGHSLGGTSAAVYAAKHKAELSGLILLAAYPTKSLKQDGFRVLSIVGTNDGGYDPEKWKDKEQFMPDDYQFEIIEGGNHGNFGNYGFQAGDGEAAISREKQQNDAAKMILDFVKLS